jgi:predicted RNA-binding Zn-ribbon protein involved in translation (DUF1610 family)
MSNSAQDLLVRGIAAAKAKQKEEARFYLEWVTRSDGDRQQKAQAWLWLSGLTDDTKEKRNCLEEVLVLDPTNRLARRGMAIVDGRLKPEEVIDTTHQTLQSREQKEEPVKSAQSQRFVCQGCGGKMTFDPNGKTLHCTYCGNEQTLFAAMQDGSMVQEHDFVVAMATIKGHASPVGMQSFACNACGASYLLSSGVLSHTCSYCGSANVLELAESRKLVPPEGIIPFAISQDEAKRGFYGWLKKKKLTQKVKTAPMRGLYLPAWTFDLSGEITWQCYVERNENPSINVGGMNISFGSSSGSYQRKKVLEKGSYPVYEDDVLVLASHKLPLNLLKVTDKFILGEVVPYTEAYLADWPAEVYEISVSDASLVARRKVRDKMGRFLNTRVNARLGYVHDLQFSTAGVLVESFKLILLPLWLTRYRREGETFQVVINGQTGVVKAQTPQNWLSKIFNSIFE